jgi:hypothetical protein
MLSVSHQMNMAKLFMHRDLAGFDFKASRADARLVSELGNLSFTDTAQNLVLIGGAGTGKPTWSPCWPCPASASMASVCASTPQSIWSICWSARNTKTKPDGSTRPCCAWS